MTARRAAAEGGVRGLRGPRHGQALLHGVGAPRPAAQQSAATEAKYNALRDAQTKTILDRIDAINTRNRPVIFAGDINSYQNNFVGNAPHDRLIANGYYDTVAAVKRINLDFPTINHYKTVLPAQLGRASAPGSTC